MADRLHRQMTWHEWQRRIGALADDCASAQPAEQARHLRDFLDLLTRAPSTAPLDGVCRPRGPRVEALLALGACESAAMAFVDSVTGCMISCGADGFHLASIALPGRRAEASARGATLALAVVAALAAAIADLSEPLPGSLRGPMPSQMVH